VNRDRRRCGALGSIRRGSVEKHQAEFADLDLVAVRQDGRFDRLTVDVGPVEAAGVYDAVFSVVGSKLGTSTADGDVVEQDVAARKPSDSRDGLVQSEASSHVAATFDDEQRGAAGYLLTACPGLGCSARGPQLQVETKSRGVMPAAVVGTRVLGGGAQSYGPFRSRRA
jgi:hypothetical protein